MPDDFDEIPKLTDLFRMVASEFFDVKEEFVNIVIDEPLENTNHPVYINLLVSEMQKNMILKGFERVDIVFSEEINEIIDSLMSYYDWEYIEALEWLEFNTIRSLPYMGRLAPIVKNTEDENE